MKIARQMHRIAKKMPGLITIGKYQSFSRRTFTRMEMKNRKFKQLLRSLKRRWQ